jgi:hypothetical protein
VSALYPEDGSPTTLRGLELLDAVIEHVTAHPETWNQQTWAHQTKCGTAMCIAGHAVAAAGATLRFRTDGHAFYCKWPDDTAQRGIRDVAEDLFDIERVHLLDEDGDDEWASVLLFAPGNDLDDVKRVRDEIAAKLGQPLRYTEAVDRG